MEYRDAPRVCVGCYFIVFNPFLITIELYSAYDGVRTSILRSMYYVVIPLLWVFSFGLIYMVIEML